MAASRAADDCRVGAVMSGKRRTEWERGFTDGYICAVANIIRTHDFPVVAKDVLKQFGKVDLRKVNKEDREIIKTLVK